MSKPQVLLRDRLYVPAEYVTQEMCDEFESQVQIGYDKGAKQPIFQAVQHYQITELSRDQTMFTFNRGDLAKIARVFSPTLDIVDQRVSMPMLHDLKIQFPDGRWWKEYQPDAIDALMRNESGILKAPARSGKSLMLTASICAEREKTIVMAHQTDLLLQFLDTFEEYTNIAELRRQSGSRIIGIPETWEDFDELDVVFCTKQTFDHPDNRKHLPEIQKLFGYALVDEAHLANAELYSQYVNRFWSIKRQGCSATPSIKSMMGVVVENVLGPLIHEIPIDAVGRPPIEVRYIHSGISAARKSLDWIRMLNLLSKAEGRNTLITERMGQQVQEGHTIIGVTDRKDHCKVLQQMLQRVGVNAVIFTGDTQNRKQRTQILNSIRSRSSPVMISMRSMTTGLDVPRADYFHNLLPSANAVQKGEDAGEGGYEQQCSRVLTQFPGKEVAYIDDYIDDIDIAWGCKKAREKTYLKIGARLVGAKDEKKQLDLVIQSGNSTEF